MVQQVNPMRRDDLKLDLTDAEWMSIIDADRDGLPPCCANISNLRDVITGLARNSGDLGIFDRPHLLQALGWCWESHDLSGFPVIVKIREQAEITDEELGHFAQGNER